MRGFMNARGAPDGPRGARIQLKDYISGKLLFVATPPGMDSIVPPVPVPSGADASQTGDVRDVVGPRHAQEYVNDFDRGVFEARMCGHTARA